MRKLTSITAFSALAITAALTLTGCTAGGEDTISKTPKPSATSTLPAESIDNKPPKTGTCDNGQLTILTSDLDKDKSFTSEQACDTVSVLTSGATITIEHDVDVVTIEGSDNTIVAQGVERTYAVGSDNTLQHTGKAPKAHDPKRDATTYEQR